MDHDHAADSCRPKRTRKADTPPPSTSSLTIGGPPLVGELIEDPSLLSPVEQQEVLDRMYRGASPLAACQQVAVDVGRYWSTLRRDRGFAVAVEQVYETLTLNVVAVLYRAAMEGNVTAQRLWLEHRPSMAWSRLHAAKLMQPDYANMSHKELNAFLKYEDQVRKMEKRYARQQKRSQEALDKEPRTQ